MKRYQIFFIVSALIFFFPFSVANATTQRFMSITDIHFNPFFSCTASPCQLIQKLKIEDVSQWKKTLESQAVKTIVPYGKDTNYALLKSTLIEIHKVAQKNNPKFAILIGDYLGHNYEANYKRYTGDQSYENYRDFVKKTLQFLTNEIRASLPNTPIYAAVGNNDSYNGDYFSDPNGSFYRNTAATWSVFFLNKKNKANFISEFPTAGYYSVTLPNDKISARIIVLNTVLFSTKAQGKNLGSFANNEIKWLSRQLSCAQANRQKVWLVFHIPIGIDIYNTISSKTTTSLLKPAYTREILKLISKYAPNIAGIFTAHLHMDAFTLFKNSIGQETFDSFTPAISPIFGNNPGFKVFTYDDNTFQIKDFVTYYLPIPKSSHTSRWGALYDFNSTYQPSCSQCSLLNGMDNLKENNPLVPDYKYYYTVGNRNSQPINTNPKDWPYYWCGIKHFTPGSYQRCLASFTG